MPLAHADQNSAQSAIASAQTAMGNCYQAIKQAENSGANVTSLVVSLNGAADLLSEAQLAYASGDYDSAYTYATQSQSAMNSIPTQASTLQETAKNDASQNFMIATLSAVTAVSILCIGVGAWVALNRKGRKS